MCEIYLPTTKPDLFYAVLFLPVNLRRVPNRFSVIHLRFLQFILRGTKQLQSSLYVIIKFIVILRNCCQYYYTHFETHLFFEI